MLPRSLQYTYHNSHAVDVGTNAGSSRGGVGDRVGGRLTDVDQINRYTQHSTGHLEIQEYLMQKHQLTRNKFTLNDISTFLKLINIFQKL